ncbi:MAG: beta-lactamase family protein [Actinobacteria bacterium]|nr:beta-lactamase family protein [Actinomycetota bacterium]
MIADLPRTSQVIADGMARGLHLGAQVYVSLRGQPLGDGAMGKATAGLTMTTEQLITWWSMTKAAVAVAVAQLWERDQVRLDDPIALHVPEFGAHGKEAITIRHCLTHTGGFRTADRVRSSTHDPEEWWAEVVAGICHARPEPAWPPGHKAGYHVSAGTMMLAEVVRRVDGRPFDRYVRDELFLPLGMTDCWVGMPVDQVGRYGERLGTMHHTAGGTAVALDHLDSQWWLTRCMPGGNGRGPMRQLARLYEALLGGGAISSPHAVRVLEVQTVEAITARHRVGMVDKTFRIVCDWGLGFAIDNVAMGRHCSRRAYGHGGAQSSIAYADPEYGLAVAIQTNGMPSPDQHYRRFAAISSAVYEDAGLADPADPGRDKPVPVEPGLSLAR